MIETPRRPPDTSAERDRVERCPLPRPEAITRAVPPWERPGAVRRDCEPHRGRLVLKLADAGLLLGALSLCLGFAALLALACGAAAWVLASRDLRRMRSGLMDPRGQADTARGRTRARAGLALGLYAAIVWGWFLAVITRP